MLSPKAGSVAGATEHKWYGGCIRDLYGFFHLYSFLILQYIIHILKIQSLHKQQTNPVERDTTHPGWLLVLTWEPAFAGTLLTLLS